VGREEEMCVGVRENGGMGQRAWQHLAAYGQFLISSRPRCIHTSTTASHQSPTIYGVQSTTTYVCTYTVQVRSTHNSITLEFPIHSSWVLRHKEEDPLPRSLIRLFILPSIHSSPHSFIHKRLTQSIHIHHDCDT
jgi:hypothetical protein